MRALLAVVAALLAGAGLGAAMLYANFETREAFGAAATVALIVWLHGGSD